MSETASSASQIITLPKGGGALHGIGETFSPDLHTGTGNFSVPISLPPGRHGFQPQLSLAYSTGSGNGPFGLGWTLSVPGVSRKTSKGVPVYDDASDVFIVSGSEDLVPVPGAPTGATRYRPRTEGLFARIDHHHDGANDYWEVRSKDGLVSLHGTPNAAGHDPAVIADPAKRKKIFAWRLTLTTDPFGNRIEYRYARDAKQADGPHRWDQLYLSEIRYVDYGDPAAPQFLVHVRFSYQDRPDPFSEYRAGFEIRTVRRCTAIEISTEPGAVIPVRTYHLGYLDQSPAPASEPPVNGVSLLSQVRVEGHDGEHSEWLPPLEFAYTRFEPETRTFTPISGPQPPPASLARPGYDLVDLFGNGLPDVLEMNGTVRYWRNRGAGRLDRPRTMAAAPAGLALGQAGVQLLDANGDGRPDLLVSHNGLSGYYPLRFDCTWDRRSFQRYRTAPSFDLTDPEVRLVDLDGDGITDVIRSGTRMQCFFNDAAEGWTPGRTRWVERGPLEDFPNVSFSDSRVRWADMTGDGLQDVVLIHDGAVDYWPSLGRGSWGKRITMRHSPRFPWGYDPKRILVGDVDGDGAADVVYVDDGRVTVWINQSGNGWSEPSVVHGTPLVADTDAVRLVDMEGSGIGGVLWSADFGALPRGGMAFLDLTGGTKPYLLAQMDNHLGAVTRVEYAPSTRFYLEDEQRPETRWKTPLPFPVQVVARVEVLDQLSGGKLTTEYCYHHGYWDGVEREFRGFGRVDHRDTETFDRYHAPGLHPPDQPFQPVAPEHFSPPTETRTWFHQGPIGDPFLGEEAIELDLTGEFWEGDPPALAPPAETSALLRRLTGRTRRDAVRALRGQVVRTELYGLDGTDRQDRPYTVTEHVYGLREEAAPGPDEPADRRRIFFSHPVAERTTRFERGDEPLTQCSFTGDYDAYGQPRSRSTIAAARGRDYRAPMAPGQPAGPYLATQTRTSYAQRDDAQHYIVDRVARSTTYEIVTDGTAALIDLQAAVEAGAVERRIVGQQRHYYDGPAFKGLEQLGRPGDYGALTRTETLILTDDVLHDGYRSGDTMLSPPEAPPYLAFGGATAWTADYPQAFRDGLPPLAGYTYQPASTGSDDAAGYFAAGERRCYDFQASPAGTVRGLVTAERDPLGRDTLVLHQDGFDLLPTDTTDPAGLTTHADYDHRVLQPSQVTDPNGNRRAYSYTPLGLLESSAVMGRAHDSLGDTRAEPGTRWVYNLLAFSNSNQQHPVSVRTIQRVHHATDLELPQPERDQTIESVECSDGFGRLLQTRAQAEDVTFGNNTFGNAGLPANQSQNADAVGQQLGTLAESRVVVNGWQVYDNKGRVIETYEPFFSQGWAYGAPNDAERGQKTTIFYDPPGRKVRIVNADGSEQRVVHGVPGRIEFPDLATPDLFEPTPWEAYTYDPNDNAGRTHPTTSVAYQSHWNTPSSVVVDALGRTIRAVERNGPNPAADWYTTHTTYDIRGNVLSVTDALGRAAFSHVYDLGEQAQMLRLESIDAGVRRTIRDAAGNVVEQRDSKRALLLHGYDPLRRPSRLWARDNHTNPVTLRELVEYGDGGDPSQPVGERETNRKLNRLGRLCRHFDEAGLVTFKAYDFKGNASTKARQVISDAVILSVFDPPPPAWQVPAYRVDWQPPASSTLDAYANDLLDETRYETILHYDALNRLTSMLCPQDVDATRKRLRSHYNRAGALERVELDGTIYVDRIAYNAKGQRVLIAYGNGIMTRYAYNPATFRLLRMRTEQYTKTDPDTYHPAGAPHQDFGYAYDLAGNLLTLHDRTPGSGLPTQPHQLDRAFTYCPVYRLLSATGRECDVAPPTRPWDNTPNRTDITRTRAYRERYDYDAVGNLRQLHHGPGAHSFARDFTLTPDNRAPTSNRLTTLTIGAAASSYAYDANGNLTAEGAARHFEWDQSDRMRVFRTQPNGAEPSIHAHYLYDASGLRVKKIVRKQGGRFEVTIYANGIFEHHRVAQAGATLENDTLNVVDNEQRIAIVRTGRALPGDATPTVQYQLSDHLGSSNAVLDSTRVLVNREEYTPYGETSFGSFGTKRYRFTGKERDEESSLYYHGARYYAPWICRWTSTDPAQRDGPNLYSYVRDCPTSLTDRNGLAAENPKGGGNKGKVGQAYQRGSYNQLRGTKIGGNAPTIREHAIPGAQLKSITYNPRTGRSDYGSAQYHRDAVYLNPAQDAAAKTHRPGPATLSDNARTRQIKNMQADAARGQGPGANVNEHLFAPSVEHASATGTPTQVAESAAFEQLQNAFGLQRLSDTAAKVAEEAAHSPHTPAAAPPAAVMPAAVMPAASEASTAAKVMGRAIEVGGHILSIAGKVAVVQGADHEAVKSYNAASGGVVNKSGMYLATFAAGVVGGAFDDAMATAGLETGNMFVWDHWEHHASGPTQEAFGEALRSAEHWWATNIQ